MRGTFHFDFSTADNFGNRCSVALSKLGNGSRKALIAACDEILDESMEQVPVDTFTLMYSAYYEITGYWKTGWYAEIGYGGNGDPVNPKTGKPASAYAMDVHEDLTANHAIGKAKFLEDPVREYARQKFPRTVFKYARSSLADMSQ